MHNSPIRNNTLLQEAYEAGYYRALNEVAEGGDQDGGEVDDQQYISPQTQAAIDWYMKGLRAYQKWDTSFGSTDKLVLPKGIPWHGG